jgi:2-dehydro-3-deoxy-L-rhamnonate dehydrogenase (NAD+)
VDTSVEGQAIAVVGAADGIGRAVAVRLAAGGARIACIDRNGVGVEAVAAELGAHAMAIACDITNFDSVPGAVQEAVSWAGQLHGLVNCAGITGTTGVPSHQIAMDDFSRVVQVNLEGAFALSRAVLPHLLEHEYGRVLHVASISGKDGNAGMVSYSASKAGLIGMVKAQGKEYAETGITINALAPAVIRTAMVEAMPDEQVTYMTDKIPMKRCGTLEEVAEMIAWIVSPACSFTTGFTFDLSGGRAVY